jgi:3-hydroxybutyryl-CoA dehydrogenase
VPDAALVVEAIVENLDVKRKLFADLEGIVGDDCILATNTSSISVTAMPRSCAARSAWSACTSSIRCR